MRAKVAGRSLAPPRLKWCTPQLPHHRDGRVATALEDVRLPAATGQLAPGALAFRRRRASTASWRPQECAATSPKCLQLPLGGHRADKNRSAEQRVACGPMILIRQQRVLRLSGTVAAADCWL